ncbi:MAG: redoxin domain-containing protein [Bacteroidota bacterium]
MAELKSIHQFSVKDTKGNEVALSDYEGKVVLIVNTASKCGFTPQLEGMEELYKELKGEDFELLAFPSNDFAGQEPLEGEAIEQFCVINYDATYPIFDKVHVKGSKAIDLFKFLSNKNENGVLSSPPKWNFHKYLVDKQGRVVDYYYSITKPNSRKVKKAIRKLLNK